MLLQGLPRRHADDKCYKPKEDAATTNCEAKGGSAHSRKKISYRRRSRPNRQGVKGCAAAAAAAGAAFTLALPLAAMRLVLLMVRLLASSSFGAELVEPLGHGHVGPRVPVR